MQEWQGLLMYIDSYMYSDEEEEIIIKHNPNATKAAEVYEKALSVLNTSNDEQKPGIRRRRGNDSKWRFDIALDCVRRMSEEDRDYVRKHMDTTEYHFGYAMGIRNKYIHPSKKNRNSAVEADGISSGVMVYIFAILHPLYDFRNSATSGYYSSIVKLSDLYGDRNPDIFDEVEQKLSNGDYATAEDAVRDLENKLREVLGEGEFIRIFKEAIAYYEENEKDNNREDWYWNVNFPSCKAILYPLQSKQIYALKKIGFFNSVERGWLKSIEDCRKDIDKNLGLKEEYADFMAKCGWEAYSPFANGKWRGMSIFFVLDIDYSSKNKMENCGIKTMGDLCECATAQLQDMGLEKDEIDKVLQQVEKLGLKFGEGRKSSLKKEI